MIPNLSNKPSTQALYPDEILPQRSQGRFDNLVECPWSQGKTKREVLKDVSPSVYCEGQELVEQPRFWDMKIIVPEDDGATPKRGDDTFRDLQNRLHLECGNHKIVEPRKVDN